MLHMLATKISFYLIKNGFAETEDQEVYAYGLEMFFASILNVLSVTVISLIIGRFFETLVFMVVFILLRRTVGGYHAPTHLSCILIFIAVYILDMKVLSDILVNDTGVYSIIFSLIATLLVFIVGPVDHENKRFSKEELVVLKNESRIIVVAQFLVVLLGFYLFKDLVNIWMSISLSAITAALSAAVARLINMNGGIRNVEKDDL